MRARTDAARRVAALEAKIVATTPQMMKPIRTANGFVPSQLNAKIVYATPGG